MAAGRTELRNRLAWLGLLCAVVACTSDDDDAVEGGTPSGGEAGGSAAGSGGTSTGGKAAGGSGDASGNLSGGEAGKDGVGGSGDAEDGGGDSAIGGDGGVQSCASEKYRLSSYGGDTEGLCVLAEHMWRRCCPVAGDIATSLRARCAPDGSYCIVTSFCTAFSPEVGGNDYECGWHDCESAASAGEGGGGGGGGIDSRCPADKVAEAWELVEDGNGVVACANDGDCDEMSVCNRRIANRMFCGEPGIGGHGGQ